MVKDYGILIQARMSSARLPGKSLFNLNKNLKVVDAVYLRCSQSLIRDKIIFCISCEPADDVLEEHLNQNGYKYFRGDANNLVKRFHDACLKYKLKGFIRVTADNPLVDPNVINHFLKLDSNIDFIDGFTAKKLPNGTIVSRISINILKHLIKYEKANNHLEHVVTSNLISNRHIPKIKDKWNSPRTRYCLDYIEDYYFLKKIFKIEKVLDLKTEDLINLYQNSNPENYMYGVKSY